MTQRKTKPHDHLRHDDDAVVDGATPTLTAPDAAENLEVAELQPAEGGPGNVTPGLVTREVPDQSGQSPASAAVIVPEGL